MGVLALLRSNYGKSPFTNVRKCFTASFVSLRNFEKIRSEGASYIFLTRVYPVQTEEGSKAGTGFVTKYQPKSATNLFLL